MFGGIKDVIKLQNEYEKLKVSNKLTKKAICDLVIPFRDKYRLNDSEALQIARDELSVTKIVELLEKSLGTNFEMKRWFVERPKGNCIVSIMKNKSDGTYSFVNLTAGHICKCRFDSVESALKDMDERKDCGEVTNWYEL